MIEGKEEEKICNDAYLIYHISFCTSLLPLIFTSLSLSLALSVCLSLSFPFSLFLFFSLCFSFPFSQPLLSYVGAYIALAGPGVLGEGLKVLPLSFYLVYLVRYCTVRQYGTALYASTLLYCTLVRYCTVRYYV